MTINRVGNSYIYKKRTKAKNESLYRYEWYTKDDWIKEYCKNKIINYGRYNDPDSLQIGKYNQIYYEDIAGFLNRREEAVFSGNEEDGYIKYWYQEAGNKAWGWGVGVYDHNKRDKPLFYLKSDQFGFSAPSKDQHIYDYYLNQFSPKSESYNNALKKVAGWIYDTRTIGGAFLWPLERKNGVWNKEPVINHVRGREVNQEDRVDLTLAYIREFYRKNTPDAFKCGNINTWLLHFGHQNSDIRKSGFKNYIDFFMFDNFVDHDTLRPKDITEDMKENILLKEGRTTTGGELLKKLPADRLEKVLDNVCNLITDRSNKIVDGTYKLRG